MSKLLSMNCLPIFFSIDSLKESRKLPVFQNGDVCHDPRFELVSKCSVIRKEDHRLMVRLMKHLSHVAQLPLLSSKCVRAKALTSYDGSSKYVSNIPDASLIDLSHSFLLFSSLTFKEGDVLNLLKRVDRSWFEGEVNGKRGLIPANFVRIIPMNAECRALYDFQISSPEQVDCLSFQKDEVITVIRKVDQNWAEGRIGDRVGIFPISFVECNPAAKSLLESHCATPPTPVSTPVADQPVAQQITACGSPSNPKRNHCQRILCSLFHSG